MKNITYLVFISSILLFSCNKDEDTSSIDDDLYAALVQESEGRGLSFYQLPNPDQLRDIPQDPNNPLTVAKVNLGQLLFHETAFATEGEFPITKGEYSCASCHHAGAGFQAGLAQGVGEGGEGFGRNGESRQRNLLCDAEKCDVQPIRSPTVLNGAFQPLMLWNGQFGATSLNTGTEVLWTPETPKAVNALGFEGLEIQAIAGLGVHRMGYSKEAVIANGYQDLFDEVFGHQAENERYSINNAGLAIAAFERTVMAYEAPFQKYLRGNTYALDQYEKEGALLFFGKANCVSCHTGPALNKMEFHALGMNEFNTNEVLHYNPEDPAQLGRFTFTGKEEDKYLFKTPQLYNLSDVNFLGHGASFHTIEEVIQYKNLAEAENPNVPNDVLASGFIPLGLTDTEVEKIAAFLRNGLKDPNLERYIPSLLPSGNCFPNNDQISQSDLGCN